MLVISLGVHLSFHFHEDELTCFSLIGSSQFCCHDIDHSEHDSCEIVLCNDYACHVEYLDFTLENDFILESFYFTSDYINTPVQGLHMHPQVNSLVGDLPSEQTNAPPEVPIYIKNSSLIFYA